MSKAKVAVIYYSLYGHVGTMAESVAEGVKSTGAEVKIFRIPETLPADVVEKMGGKPPNTEHPEVTKDDLPEFDAFIFGIPTRFGMMASQVKAFFDTTGGLWMSGGLVGKVAGIFFSTGTLGGGQETTALTAITQLTHHGMIFVPIGYSSKDLLNMDEIHGGSPYGAGTLAGEGARQPSKLELGLAEHQGKHIATVANALKAGKS